MKISDIIGHNDKIRKMVTAYENKRLAHAYIFHGPKGIGKRSSALAFIKYVFCSDTHYKNLNLDSCSACPSCRKIEADNHPDLIMVEPENSYIKIGMIRDLQKRLKFGKYDAAFRFVIIDDAEFMRKEAANALLKTLEEPASDVVIILVTSKVNMLLPTIRSRCQKVRFNPLSLNEVKGELMERHGLDEGEAKVISTFLQGSLSKMDTADLDGIIELRKRLIKKIKEVSLSNFAGIVKLSTEIAKEDKELLVDTVEMIKTFYRDAALIKTGTDRPLINEDIESDIKMIAKGSTLDGLFFKINIMTRMQGLLMANVNKRLLMESMFIELCA